ncbi:UDP-2,3-diacylglucosamine diphosphatase LpxI [Alphaproteobacteria bacterium]|nr:UDP-2,3-diacylglucosamine diphosphatase LpxI [Alphaproteobacteria bacterium]
MMKGDSLETLGIVAGDGQLPQDICERAAVLGRQPVIVVLGTGQETDGTVPWYTSYTHKVIPLGDIQRSLDFLTAHRVKEIIFAGRIQRPNLLKFRPDALGATWLVRLLPTFGRDDALLRKVAELFGEKGFEVISPKKFLADEQVAAPHTHWGMPLTEQNQKDIAQGMALLNDLSDHDVGQAVVVAEGRVYGIEAAEGTDELLRRVADYRRGMVPGGVFVKMAKKRQDMRLDLPVIGAKTLEGVMNAGLSGVALQAGGVILLGPRHMKQYIENKDLFLTTEIEGV